MNKKIKEIANLVKLQPYYDAQEGQIEQFAKLIIQECMEQCFSEDDEQRIAKHFGFDIEEEE